MYTPAEAMKLWCPMVRVAVSQKAGGPCSVNDPTALVQATCIADLCAMWRWEHTTKSVPTMTEGARTFEQKVVKTHGYCGLAGAPWSAAA